MLFLLCGFNCLSLIYTESFQYGCIFFKISLKFLSGRPRREKIEKLTLISLKILSDYLNRERKEKKDRFSQIFLSDHPDREKIEKTVSESIKNAAVRKNSSAFS